MRPCVCTHPISVHYRGDARCSQDDCPCKIFEAGPLMRSLLSEHKEDS